MTEEVPKLTYVTDQASGYTRIKKNNSFVYLNENSRELSEEGTINRIDKLMIPPIWTNVWICKDEAGHLQCTGRDLKGRKQYIYHPLWSCYKQRTKFKKMKGFGLALSKIRKHVEQDLSQPHWSKEKVLALIVHLLDDYFLRIGNSRYTTQNESYGITTLRRKHIDTSKGHLTLEYQAKSNRVRKIDVDNKRLAKLVREISELPGYEIFRYRENSRTWHDIDSSDVNEYIQRYMGNDYSAKDFRTWGASKLAIKLYDQALEKIQDNKRLKFEPTLVRLVAQRLGNKRSTCRKYYIHPDVLSAAMNHKLPGESKERFHKLNLEEEEKLLLTLIT